MKKELKILLATYCFSTFAFSMLSPIYAIFVEKIGGGVLEASYAISIFSFSSGVLIYIVSKLEDKVKHQEYLLSLGYLLNALAFFLYIYVSKPMHLYFIEILFGVSIAVLSPVYDGLYSKNLDKGKYVSEWGDWEAVGYFISSISALLGGFLTATFGFKTLFLSMSFLSFMAFLVSLILNHKENKNIKLAKIK